MNRIIINGVIHGRPTLVPFSWALEVGGQGERVAYDGWGEMKLAPSADYEYVYCDVSFTVRNDMAVPTYSFISRNVRNIPLSMLELIGFHFKGFNLADPKVVDNSNVFNGFADLFKEAK